MRRRRCRARRGSARSASRSTCPRRDGDSERPGVRPQPHGLQLPGATAPRDIRVSADGADELDDALLDLVLSLVKAQADAAAANSLIAAVGGLLGLKSGDAIPDFPITQLPGQGVHGARRLAARHPRRHHAAAPTGSATWPRCSAARAAATRCSSTSAAARRSTLGLRVDTGPSGNARLTPSLGIELGDADARVEARADLLRHRPRHRRGDRAAAARRVGRRRPRGHRVLDVSNPTVARADTLRVGFALDSARRLTFVLAADGVTLGSAQLRHARPDVARRGDGRGRQHRRRHRRISCSAASAMRWVWFANCSAWMRPPVSRAITLPALMTDPVAAVSGYWQQLIAAPAAATTRARRAAQRARRRESRRSPQSRATARRTTRGECRSSARCSSNSRPPARCSRSAWPRRPASTRSASAAPSSRRASPPRSPRIDLAAQHREPAARRRSACSRPASAA